MSSEEKKVYEVYISRECLAKTYRHAYNSLPREAIGFLIGRPFKWKDKVYTVVYDCVEGRAKATEVHVEFEEDALGEVALMLREKGDDSIIVGWYHSHPGYGCFLSPIDVKSHKDSFKENFHIALVIDPINKKAGFFKINGENVNRASVAVVDPKKSDERMVE